MTTSVEVEITMEDVIAFSQYHFMNSPSRRKGRMIMQFGLPLAWLAITLPISKGSVIAIIFFNLLLVCGWVFWYPSLLRSSIRRVVLKTYGEGRNKSTFGKHIFSLLQEYLLEVGDFGETRTKWDFIEKVIRTDDFILLYNGAAQAFIVPRRFFPVQEAYDAFFREAESLRARFTP